MSLLFLFVCVELVTEEKYESVTKWNGLPCALQDVFDVLSMYFWYSVLVFLITGPLCSQRGITKSMFLLACNFLWALYSQYYFCTQQFRWLSTSRFGFFVFVLFFSFCHVCNFYYNVFDCSQEYSLISLFALQAATFTL